MTIEFHEDAETDLQDAIRYYSEISWRLVAQFEAEVQSVLQTMRGNPRHYHLTRDRLLRRANLRQFPFRILYQVDEEQTSIHIIVVCHNKRHPSYGLDRI